MPFHSFDYLRGVGQCTGSSYDEADSASDLMLLLHLQFQDTANNLYDNTICKLTLLIAYNKWHETELERWLSDHNVPYPTPADRKDLENLVKSNWDSKIATPYHDWETPQLQSYLKAKGADAKTAAATNKDSLVKQVKGYWTETSDSASNSYNSVKDWIFDRSSSIPIL